MSKMHFIVNSARYVISYKTAFADNFTNKKPAQHFNGDQCIDSSFLKRATNNLGPIIQNKINKLLQ